MAKKIKVTLKGGVVRMFNLDRVDIVPSHGDKGPGMLHLNKCGENKYMMHVTSNIIPDVEFFEKIEIVEQA